MLCAFPAGHRRGAWTSLVATSLLIFSSLMPLFLAGTADAAALGSLVCDPSTLVESGPRSRTASCSFSLEGDDASSDLFHMDAFAFNGLDGASSVVFLRTKSTLDTFQDNSQETFWMGSNSDDMSYGFTTLVQGSSDDGGLAGNINTEHATYLLVPGSSIGTIRVREMLWKTAQAFSPTGVEAELDGTDAVDLDVSDAIEVTFPKLQDRETLPGSGSGIDSDTNRNRKLQETADVRVLVLVTNRAMCESADLEFGCPYTQNNSKPILSLLGAGRSEINTAFEDLLIPAKINVVKVVILTNETDVTPNDEILDYMKENTRINELREENEANVVAMLTGDDPQAEAGGRADLNGYTSATAWTSFSEYGFMHQLMHNFGARHNRDDSDELHPYAHGLQVPNATVPFRTVMAYPCANVSCPPIPFLSSSTNFSYQGSSLGDETHDNARMVSENANAVANFAPPSRGFFDWLFGLLCFSDRMTVVALGKGSTRMDQLEVGDWVLTKDGSYSKVYGFGHRNSQLKTKFLQIHTTDDKLSGAPLELTSAHMLYVFNESTEQTTLIPASQIKAGDLLMMTGASSGVSTRQVKHVYHVTRTGVYAPFTVTGDIVVNGIASSNYIALPASFQQLVSYDIQHSLQHAAYVPYRLFCGMSLLVGGDSCKVNHEERAGFSEGVWLWLPFLQWLEKHHSHSIFLPFFLYAVAVPVQWIILLLEKAVLALSMLHLVAALVGYMVWKKHLPKTKKTMKDITLTKD